MRDYDAANALGRIANSSAFSLPEAQMHKLNQHSTLYTFKDGSKLQLFLSRGRADAWHPAWTGRSTDTRLGPVKGASIRVNAQGVRP